MNDPQTSSELHDRFIAKALQYFVHLLDQIVTTQSQVIESNEPRREQRGFDPKGISEVAERRQLPPRSTTPDHDLGESDTRAQIGMPERATTRDRGSGESDCTLTKHRKTNLRKSCGLR